MVSASKKGAHQARSWAAPQMESFANVVESSITPAVTSSLRSSAKKIQPPRQSRMSGMSRAILSWRGLMALIAVLGAAGAAAGIAMRKRCSGATAEADKTTADTTTTVVPEPNGGPRAAPDDYRIGSGSGW
jgi:hypothetical protein